MVFQKIFPAALTALEEAGSHRLGLVSGGPRYSPEPRPVALTRLGGLP